MEDSIKKTDAKETCKEEKSLALIIEENPQVTIPLKMFIELSEERAKLNLIRRYCKNRLYMGIEDIKLIVDDCHEVKDDAE